MKRILFLLILFCLEFGSLSAQDLPDIDYTSAAHEYEIAEISVVGADNYEDFVIVGFSGLKVGQRIKVPGDDVTNAVKRFWKQGLFSDVEISATKITDGKIWLQIALKTRPKISKIEFHGFKKAEQTKIEPKISLVKGGQITPNQVDRTRDIIRKEFIEKGFLNADVKILERPAENGNVDVDIVLSKNERVKIKRLDLYGNEALSFNKINWTMKKTNPKGKLFTFFRTKKYIPEKYEEDKVALIDKYNEFGYRDARIVADTVDKIDNRFVRVAIELEEGKKYYFGDITWVGNTLYPSDYLQQVLRVKRGDVYNQKYLNDRLSNDEDAVSNLYLDNGYLFFSIDPVEVRVNGDTIDLEMRMYEGAQARINNININGNTRVFEHVVRRELRVKPGQLFSKTDLQRSFRELAQMGHFDPEKMQPDIQPDMENGTVDVNFNLETKSSDQIELSLGYGSTGVTGSIGLKFTNFSIQNLFNPSTYRIVPQGDGQTLSLRAETNAKYYQSYSISFLEPWLGGRRPNSLSFSAFFSKQTGVSDRYYSSGAYESNYYYSYLYGDDFYNSRYIEYDDEKFIKMFGASMGVGTRLSWPDDYFTFYGELAYQHYNLQSWRYFILTDGHANNLNLNFTLSRSSINNPYYTTNGSEFSVSVQFTPPYSLFDGKDYEHLATDKSADADAYLSEMQQKYRWVEYHKWKIKGKIFVPLSKNEKLVLMGRAEYGFLGYYNKYKRSPFETFYMGGDGMSTNSYSAYAIEAIGLRGYENGSLTPIQSDKNTQIGNVYAKMTMELRYPIVTGGQMTVYLLAFAEAGNCWYDFKEFNPFQLKRSAGAGIRIFMPMLGLLGVDWGYGFDKVQGTMDYSKSQFHFVLGREF